MAGLARLGWDMEGITRRGFPYDRWPKKDTREVAEFDEVDGIRYHRVLTDARVYPQYPLRAYIDKYAAEEIGRTSCRERVCQYVKIQVVADTSKTNTKNT